MIDQDSFDFEAQQDNLERVSSRIAAAIIAFCVDRLRTGYRQFHAEDVRKHVAREVGFTAPGSADRILRLLRQRKLIQYRILNRRGSLYELIWVKGQEVKAA